MPVHGHLAEKILFVGILHYQRTESVPQVVERIEALRIAGTLIARLHERTSQLDGIGQHLLPEPVAETEIVFRREIFRIRGVADNVAVAAKDFTGYRVPYEQLRITVRSQVLFVDIHLVPRTAPGLPECELTQTAYLPHDVGSLRRLYRVNEVSRIVGGTQQALLGQFPFDEFLRYGFYYRFHGIRFIVWMNTETTARKGPPPAAHADRPKEREIVSLSPARTRRA